MEYAVEVTEIAAAEIDSAYEWIKERAPDAAERWYTGLMTALTSLRQNPKRYARVFAAEFEGLEIRQLVYGRRRGRYRILFYDKGRHRPDRPCPPRRDSRRPPLTALEFSIASDARTGFIEERRHA